MTKQKAFLFDMNGTMIDDMQYHIVAWHRIMNELGANISMEEMKEECYGKNDELLERSFPGRFTAAEKQEMSLAKEKAYQEEFKPHLQLLPGLSDFLLHCQQHQIALAIGSAAIQYNIDFVLDGLNIRSYFKAIVSADDVTESKPSPETYLKCADQLGIKASDCIVFEDSTKGIESALRANMKAVAISSMHTAAELAAYPNVLLVVKDFTDPRLMSLFAV